VVLECTVISHKQLSINYKEYRETSTSFPHSIFSLVNWIQVPGPHYIEKGFLVRFQTISIDVNESLDDASSSSGVSVASMYVRLSMYGPLIRLLEVPVVVKLGQVLLLSTVYFVVVVV
jgi:hypothetical protein